MKFIRSATCTMIWPVALVLAFTSCAGPQKTQTESPKESKSVGAQVQLSPAEYTLFVGWLSSKDISKKCVPPKEETGTAQVNVVGAAPLGALKPAIWKSWTESGIACVAHKTWDTAEKWGSLLLEREPAAPWGSYILSLAAEGRGEIPRALWMIELSLKKAPMLGAFYLQKARLMWIQKEYAVVVQTLEKGIASDPRFTENHKFLAQIYLRDQDFDKSTDLFAQVISHRSDDEIALNGLAEGQIQKGNHQAAVQTLENGISRYPKRLDWRLRQAFVYEEILHSYAEALNRYQKIEDLAKRSGAHLTVNVGEKITGLKKLIAKKAEEAATAQATSERKPAENKTGAPVTRAETQSGATGGKKQ